MTLILAYLFLGVLYACIKIVLDNHLMPSGIVRGFIIPYIKYTLLWPLDIIGVLK